MTTETGDLRKTEAAPLPLVGRGWGWGFVGATAEVKPPTPALPTGGREKWRPVFAHGGVP